MSKLILVVVLAAVLAGVIALATTGVSDINQANDRGVTAIQTSTAP